MLQQTALPALCIYLILTASVLSNPNKNPKLDSAWQSLIMYYPWTINQGQVDCILISHPGVTYPPERTCSGLPTGNRGFVTIRR